MTSTSFAELGVPADLVAVLEAADKTSAFPIQQATLPSTLAGKDVLGRGKTGSGKTLAFSIPLVTRVAELKRASGEGRRPKGLVLLPTRELATQVANVITPLAAARRLNVATVFGGVKQGPQERAFRQGVDILVACPGRLDDLMRQGIADLSDVEVTVLDEADHMADLGFLPVVTRILNATPTGRQRLLFSATLDNGIDKLVKRYLRNPIVHSVDEANSPVAAMTHHVYEVASTTEKTKLVRTLASGAGRRILFMRTKHQAKKLARQLTAAGIPAVDLHGNLSQNARDRNLAAFSSGEVRVLVATDVAARGVHVDGIELVVHVDPPAEHKAYLHRSGRTARAGAEGDVVTIMLPEQRQDTRQLLRRAQITVTPREANFQSPFVLELVGEQAPHVAPVPGGPGVGNEPKQQPAGTSNGANARRKRAARAQRGQGAQGGSGAAGGQGAGRGQSRAPQSEQGVRGGQGSRNGQGSRAGQGARTGQGTRSSQGARTGQGARTSQGQRNSRGQSAGQPRQNVTR